MYRALRDVMKVDLRSIKKYIEILIYKVIFYYFC